MTEEAESAVSFFISNTRFYYMFFFSFKCTQFWTFQIEYFFHILESNKTFTIIDNQDVQLLYLILKINLRWYVVAYYLSKLPLKPSVIL